MTFNNVDFPAPFLPIRPILSFGLIKKLMSLNSSKPPKLKRILSNEIICLENCAKVIIKGLLENQNTGQKKYPLRVKKRKGKALWTLFEDD
jgi:hypothetical protein